MSEERRGDRRHANVVNVSELEEFPVEKGSRFGARIKALGRETGAGVGCNWFEVQPGRTSFPYHYHCATEEAIFVLEGEGTLRIGDEEVAISSGDFLAFPVGPEHAHQLINTGSAPLRYLCMSNKVKTDVVGYPDSGKVAAMGSPSSDFMAKPWIRGIFREDTQVDYYDGEKTE